MRRKPGAADAWAKSNVPGGACKGYDDLDAFLAHPGLDAVYVATRPGTHLEIAQKVANAGKACYVEKPVGRSAKETEEMSELFERKGLPLYTAYISRAYERTDATKRLLSEGAIGDRVTGIEYTLRGIGGARGMEGEGIPWRLDASQSGGGLIMDVGCHVIDRIDYLFGPLTKVSGKASNRNSPQQDVEDYVELKAEIGKSSWAAIHSHGAVVKCIWDFGADDGSACDELIITGTDGWLKMAAMSPSLPISVLGSDGTVVQELSFDTPRHTAQRLIQEVTDELRGMEGAASPSKADNALRTSKVLDTVLGSYYAGREDTFWLRPDTWPGRPH